MLKPPSRPAFRHQLSKLARDRLVVDRLYVELHRGLDAHELLPRIQVHRKRRGGLAAKRGG